jgi:hypothetical protein
MTPAAFGLLALSVNPVLEQLALAMMRRRIRSEGGSCLGRDLHDLQVLMRPRSEDTDRVSGPYRCRRADGPEIVAEG